MSKPSIGAAVKYHVSGRVHDAIVVGFDPQPDDAKTLPAASLAFFNPAKAIHLSGAEWAHSFERVDSVPHADETRFSWYTTAADGLPTAEDLDAVAEEDEAKEATSGKAKGNGKKAKLIAGA